LNICKPSKISSFEEIEERLRCSGVKSGGLSPLFYAMRAMPWAFPAHLSLPT
jgi:hypothetical protein